MSTYTPGTKLSYDNANECCTVLTNGNALVTKVWGERWWEQMRLADWLILADGHEEEDFIPISKAEEDDSAYDDLPPLVSLSEAEVNQFWADLGRRSAELEKTHKKTYSNEPIHPKVKTVKRPIGTKLKWVSDEDEETYRVAIVTKHGVCQVKAVTEGGGDCYYVGKKRYLTKRTFDSESSWRGALPSGGEVYVY